jgi:hypothetical protein
MKMRITIEVERDYEPLTSSDLSRVTVCVASRIEVRDVERETNVRAYAGGDLFFSYDVAEVKP